MKRNFTRWMLSAALLTALGGSLMAQEVTKPVADLLDVKFNADGTAEDVSPMKNTVETVGTAFSTYYNDAFGFVVANFTNNWGQNNSSGYRIDYEQNEEFKNKLADGHSLEMVVMADYSEVKDVEIKPFSSMEAGGTGFLITGSNRGNVMTFLPNASADGNSKWNWCTSGISPEKKVYYHFVGVWNQEEGKAYIYCNGKLMNSISTDKQFRFANDGSKWFCIGGDPGGSNIQAGWRGDVAVARVYGDPLTGEQAEALWQDVKGGVDAANVLVIKQSLDDARTYIGAEDFIAYSAYLEAYTAQLDKMDALVNAGDAEALAAEKVTLATLRLSLDSSVVAYKAYRDEVNNTLAYLDENTDFEGAARALLEDYLQSDEAPGETYANGGALYIMDVRQLDVEQIKAETQAVKEMLKRAIETGVKSGVEITNLFTNTDFSDGLNGWQGLPMNGTIKSSTTGFTAAECFAKNCNTYQTLEHRNNGVYVMKVNGAYRPYDDYYSTYYAAQVYLNGTRLYLPTVYETYIPVADVVDGQNCYLTKTTEGDGATDKEIYSERGSGTDLVGYAMHGRASIANAAAAGRALNYLVTVVTDSTLTLGVENANTVPGSDWVGISNIHVIYYETLHDAEAYIDSTLQCMAARAQGIIEFEPSTGSDYAQHPGCPNVLKELLQQAIAAIPACTSAEDKYALVETFSSLFQQVLEARKAYVSMVDEAMFIFDILQKLDADKIITDAEYNNGMEKYDAVIEAFEKGTYTTEQAREVAVLKETGFYPQLVDGVYQISTNAQLIYFAGKAPNGVVGKLVADIPNFTAGQMLDHLDGILDGDGHKITLNMNCTENGAALMRKLQKNAEVRNLIIDGTITTSAKFAAAVTVDSYENSRISNVTSSINIVSGIIGDGTHGGLIAVVNGYTLIDNCLFNGTMTGSSTDSSGGLVGWNSAASRITNCLQLGDIQMSAAGSNTIGRRPVNMSVRNTYFKTPYGDIAGTQVTDEQLASGEVCYLLNEGNTENPKWFQNIDSDPYPVLDPTHKVVGLKKDGGYTNDESLFYHETDVPETDPVADILDIVFNEDGTATDVSPLKNAVEVRGVPTVSYNDSLKLNVAHFDNPLGGAGTHAYGIDYSTNSEVMNTIALGHTMEAVVMLQYEGEIPNVEAKPFSSMEAGGTGFLISTKSDARQNEFTFLPNVSTTGNSTWRWTTSGVVPEAGKFYHIIGVFDQLNCKARIYVDGKLCNEVDAPGIFRFANDGCKWFCIGGDPGSNNSIGNSWRGDVALARVYGKALTDKEVQKLVKKFNGATAIEQVASQETKAPTGIYTINGIRVQKTTKGLYIINGKKVMVK